MDSQVSSIATVRTNGGCCRPSSLAFELWLSIARQLDAVSLLRLSFTCRYLREALSVTITKKLSSEHKIVCDDVVRLLSSGTRHDSFKRWPMFTIVVYSHPVMLRTRARNRKRVYRVDSHLYFYNKKFVDSLALAIGINYKIAKQPGGNFVHYLHLVDTKSNR